MMMRLVTVLALILALGTPALAVQPDEILPDADMEQRARAISADLRCLVCQNQSIDDSDAPLARDLRILVRQRLVAGDTNGQAVAFVVDRYGDYVLLKPPFKWTTLLLWIAPLGALLFGLWFLVSVMRERRVMAEEAPGDLTPEEQARVKALLRDGDS